MHLIIMDAVYLIEGKEKTDEGPQGKKEKGDRQWRPEGEVELPEAGQDEDHDDGAVKADLLDGRRVRERVQKDEQSHECGNAKIQSFEDFFSR